MQSKKTVVQACAGGRIFGSDGDSPLSGFTYDSREVSTDGVFVAVRGLWVDGHDYIPKALEAGASLVIAETAPTEPLPRGCTWVQVPDSAIAMGHAANAFYGRPSEGMTTFAVTGTNGKTTVTSMVFQVLKALEVSPGLVGTVEHRFAEVVRKTVFTTPPSADLHALLAEMRDAKVTHVALEASSHGLAQHRLAAVDLDIGAFTNLTQDHLDYHETMESYFEAKALLFRELVGAAVFNVDDAAGAQLASEFSAAGKRTLTFSTRLAKNGGPNDWKAEVGSGGVSALEPTGSAEGPEAIPGKAPTADMRVTAMTCAIDGTTAQVETPWGAKELTLPMVGQHNVANALTTLGMLVLAGFSADSVIAALAQAPGAAGRLEVVPGPRHVIVDYAHTPDALVNVCSALRPLTKDRLIVVFGAGGDRDPSKRPKMGAAVQRYADLSVVTSDNPRTEAPEAIVEAIVKGMQPGDDVIVEVDRRRAIRAAVELADRPGDVVLIAGKGHEDYQIIGTHKAHFDDREEARAALSAISGAAPSPAR